MQTPYGHLSYCSNIHPGEDWKEHFEILKHSIPVVKAGISPDKKMGIGLRLANQASIDLSEESAFTSLKTWLKENDCYVFTMNGFPYGNFHDVVVKDQVHAPDWTTPERLNYTIRLFKILSQLLPEDQKEGGISTSPLSYRFWWKTNDELKNATQIATENLLTLVEELAKIETETGKTLHLDMEPEPDGILENSGEFIDWYQKLLIPMGIKRWSNSGLTSVESTLLIQKHIQLCYDVCHFAVGYEKPDEVIAKMKAAGIKVGKIQISSALRIDFTENAADKLKEIAQYNEPTYLHQVVAQKANGEFIKYPDLEEAINGFNMEIKNWRVHFHVPLFLENYGILGSTQADIEETLDIQKKEPFTNHMEVETYTWGVLPIEFRTGLNESIIRELTWVKGLLA